MTDPMRRAIRVLLVDDQELFRSGVSVIIDAQPDMEVVGPGRQRVATPSAGRRAASPTSS